MRARVWAWWCAVFLSGGLLGLLVCNGAGRISRHRYRTSCASCRRRRRVWQGVVGALTLVVLTGSAMWAQQQASPSVPDCTSDLLADRLLPGTSTSSSPPAPEHDTWRATRSVLTAPVTGIAYHYADTRGGGLCSTHSVTVAFVPSAASDTALTVGDVFVTGLPEDQAQGIARHESAHVTQWAVLTLAGGPLALPVLYSLDDAVFPGARNHFERAAGLRAGNYDRPGGFGPAPQWGRVMGITLLLVLLFWRRLRWACRALLLGSAGARYRERGRCPVHSRGWAQIGS